MSNTSVVGGTPCEDRFLQRSDAPQPFAPSVRSSAVNGIRCQTKGTRHCRTAIRQSPDLDLVLSRT